MKEITEKQYDEYVSLRRWAKREKVWVSAKGITKLEDDVDLPIKKCVAMCALLGLEPLFSCCGFDYDGQPYHKSHQYGEPYIMFKSNPKTLSLLTYPPNWKFGWLMRKHVQNTILLVLKVEGNPHWRKKDCIHFAEELVISIAWLERFLSFQKDAFLDEIILCDTNQNYKKSGVRFWQYPPKEDWVIQKEMIESY
jgi:hypothetical protein